MNIKPNQKTRFKIRLFMFSIATAIYFALAQWSLCEDIEPSSVFAPQEHSQPSGTDVVTNLTTLFEWQDSRAYAYCFLKLAGTHNIKSDYVTHYDQMIDVPYRADPFGLHNDRAVITLTVPGSLKPIPDHDGMCVVMDGFDSPLPLRAANVFSWNFDAGFAARLVLGQYIKSWQRAGWQVAQSNLDFTSGDNLNISTGYTNIYSYVFYSVGAIQKSSDLASPRDFIGPNGVPYISQFPPNPLNPSGYVFITPNIKFATYTPQGQFINWLPSQPTASIYSYTTFYPDNLRASIIPSSWLPYKVDLDHTPLSRTHYFPYTDSPAVTEPYGENYDAMLLLPNFQKPEEAHFLAFFPGVVLTNMLSFISFNNGLYFQLKAHGLQAPGILWGWRAASQLEENDDPKYLNAALGLLRSHFSAKQIGELSGYALSYLHGYSKMITNQKLISNQGLGYLETQDIFPALFHDSVADTNSDLLVSLHKAFLGEFYALSLNKKLPKTQKSKFLVNDAAFIDGFEESSVKTTDQLYSDIFVNGYSSGIQQGYLTGFNEGYAAGYRDGYGVGYSNGYSSGYTTAWQNANVIISNLSSQLASSGSSSSSWLDYVKTAVSVGSLALAAFGG